MKSGFIKYRTVAFAKGRRPIEKETARFEVKPKKARARQGRKAAAGIQKMFFVVLSLYSSTIIAVIIVTVQAKPAQYVIS